MRLCYVLLSPTWGMHQYTADLANRMAAVGRESGRSTNEVHVVTTRHVPRDRYAPEVRIHTPAATKDSGFSLDGIWHAVSGIPRVSSVLRELQPDVVHLGGPHLWNPLLLRTLRRAGIPTVHTLHDLHPHAGAAYGRLLYGWNAWVKREADHLLVHGERWREEIGGEAITCTLLTHLFVGHQAEQALREEALQLRYEPWALFVGRLLPYKGLEVLIEAARRLEGDPAVGMVIGGPGRLERLVPDPLPANVEVRNGLVGDGEVVELFRRCGVVVLPYIEASQSALVAAAYRFCKPVIVTRTGALPEYVVEGETGWVVPPGDAGALAEALGSALGDPARLARAGQAGRAWYEHARKREEQTLREMYARMGGAR